MDLLRIAGDQIIDGCGRPVRLRGFNIGGWMNLENFINGFPGSEHGLRAAMAYALGLGRAEFFFERLLDHFLTEEDIAFLKSLGANVVRLPINYRHLESDAAPFQYLERGFARLQLAVDWCARHEVYVVLDLHAAPGWQNPDWHCDNDLGQALFWQHPHFQQRWLALWQELARRYRGNPAVAGYDLLNEPASRGPAGAEDCRPLDGLYTAAVTAIRAVDPDHIIFLEGDDFGSRFRDLAAPCAANVAYEGHDYNPAVMGPGAYPGAIGGVDWDRARLRLSLGRHQAAAYARRYGVPLWMGEFGTVFTGPAAEVPDRLAALDDQMGIYEEMAAHWTAWTYKDIGVMGLVSMTPDAGYLQRIAPVLAAKARLEADTWSGWGGPAPARGLVNDLARFIADTVCDPELDPGENERRLAHAILSRHSASLLQPCYARCFAGLAENELDVLLAGFSLRQCRPNQGLIDIFRRRLSPPLAGRNKDMLLHN